jgi:hypothetical protein
MAELLKGRLRVADAQCQLQPGGQPFRAPTRSPMSPYLIPACTWIRTSSGSRRELAATGTWPGRGLVPRRISFSAGSHGISASSAWPLRVVSLIMRTASSTRPSAR